MAKCLSALCAGALILNLTACGTILHPERSGQSKSGKLDIGIVALDGVGLLFFLVPGIIAYAVDFNNGTIYLPAGQSNLNGADNTNEMMAFNVGKENLTDKKIAAVVSSKVGYTVDTSSAQAYKINLEGNKVKVSNENLM